jgi:hypothetical protein
VVIEPISDVSYFILVLINFDVKIPSAKSYQNSLCLQGAHLLAPEWKNNCSQYRVFTKGMKRTISTVMAQSLFQLMHSPKSGREERERERKKKGSAAGEAEIFVQWNIDRHHLFQECYFPHP